MRHSKSASTEGDYPSVEEIRYLNCRRLMATYNIKIVDFAETIKKSHSHAGALVGSRKQKVTISGDMARHIENSFLLPENFLDNMHCFDSEETVRDLNVDAFKTLRAEYLAEKALVLKDGVNEFSLSKKSLMSSIVVDQMSETVAKSFSPKYTSDHHDLLERLNTIFTFSEVSALADHVVSFLSRDTALRITKPHNKL